MIKLYNGDCLEIMKNIPDKSVDLVLCDLPYGLTNCKWDSVIPMDKLWKEYERILKPSGTVLLFAQPPFSSMLVNSNKNGYSHIWYWFKNNRTGALNAHNQPLKCIEEVLVFRRSSERDNEGLFLELRKYMLSEKEKTGMTTKELQALLGSQMTSHYFTMGKQFSIPTKEAWNKLQTTGYFQRDYENVKTEYDNEMSKQQNFTYNPQGLIELEKPEARRVAKTGSVYQSSKKANGYKTHTNFPNQVLQFNQDLDRVHPTQKPVALLEYLVKTYSNEGETILDNCMGSGSTGVACMNTGRKFIGIELDAGYYAIAEERINNAIKSV